MTAYVGDNTYGKTNVLFLRVDKSSPQHKVYEIKAQCLLEGPFESAFTEGSNAKVIPTETQKNTLYALSKKYPMDSLEEWAQHVAQDILGRHSHVTGVNLQIESTPWTRIQVEGKPHNHAFVKSESGIKCISAKVTRANGLINLSTGWKDLKVLKTTQSGFEGFIRDEYTTLQPTTDRVLCTKIRCDWTFNTNIKKKIDFNEIFQSVQKTVLNEFAGPADTGVYSASVQKTIFEAGKAVLSRYPEVDKVSFELPNIHFYLVDFSQFKTDMKNNNEVFFTFEGAAGLIRGTVQRDPPKVASKL